MITDANLRVSEAQSLTATAVSDESIDLGTARDIGAGRDIYAAFTTTTTLAGTSPTITFEIIVADDAALTTNVEVISSAGPYTPTQLTVGTDTIYLKASPYGWDIAGTGRRYLGTRYTVGGTVTGFAVTCDFVLDPQDEKYYASGIDVTAV